MSLPPRVPLLAWARVAATEGLDGLRWVDSTVLEDARPFSIVEDDDGGPRFRHVPYGLFLPPPMVQAAQEAAERGEPTVLEGLLLLFARPEWLVAARGLLWTPLGPLPRLLAPLVEAYGADTPIHRGEAERLVRLLAHLPRWYPRRGPASEAVALLGSALDEAPAVEVVDDRAADETFACRGVEWWAGRDGGHEALRVEGGVLRIVASGRPETRVEDVTLRVPGPAPFPVTLLRFLPVWASVRLLSERAA